MAGNKIFVYRHIRLDTGEVFYVGIGVGRRPFLKSNRNKYWKNIVAKAGYKVEILATVYNREEACELEELLIETYGRIDLGNGSLVNMTSGGEGLTSYKFTSEQLNKLSESHKGQIPWNKGKTFSEETKKKMSDAKKGNSNALGFKHSKEFCERISALSKGRIASEETRRKMSKNRKGIPLPENVKEKLRESSTTAKRIIDTETGIIYRSIKECAEAIGIKRSTLSYRLLKGNNKMNLKYL